MKVYPNIGNFLVHCYLYYVLNDPIISDEVFDKLCKILHDEWDTKHKFHMHAHLVSKEDLAAGTGYAIRDYPLIVQHLAQKAQSHRNKLLKPKK